MPQLFHRSTNTIAKVSIFGAVFILAGALWVVAELSRSAYFTGKTVVLAQPVPFSHDHHTAALGIDCRYCHTTVETAAFAGVPPTSTCMNCHKYMWNDSPMLEPVRESWRTGRPLEWSRVHDLPDFVYFDHSIHVAKGIGCESCHGRVDRMPLIHRAETLQMEWCLSCHRDPAKAVRPREAVFQMGWKAPAGHPDLGRDLVEDYEIESRTNCTTCHR